VHNPQAHYSNLIKQKAAELGFSFCGISKAEFLEDDARRLESWLNKGYQGKMSYMERHFDLRTDPSKLVPGAKSVISFLYNYYSDQKQDASAPKISKYAFGTDYHFVIKDKLKTLLAWIKENIGEVDGRAFVDSAPVLERTWAARSGLGWIGKNGNLINKQQGSFFFLSELILDLELEPDGPLRDYCGSCTACMDACPTDAILPNREIEGSKCISYFTIELKDEIPSGMKGQFGNWAFGCDVCQDVCPWNRFSKAHNEPAFNVREGMMDMNKKDWEDITEEVFRKLFKDSPVKRTGFKGLKRNIEFLKPGRKHSTMLEDMFNEETQMGRDSCGD
jgi:epoxyqueuosine reductase